MTDQIRTPEDIEKLKASWKHDPCWDIEDTEGFEAYHDELLAWRKEYEVDQDRKWREAEDKRIEIVMNATGIGKVDRDLMLSIKTWDEIEFSVKEQDAYLGSFNSREAIVTAELAQAQIRATLLQAAQLKRIADALESMADGDSLVTSTKIWGS